MELPPTQDVMRLLGGYMVTQAFRVVVESGLADRVGDEPVPLEELAGHTGIPAAQLTRLLRALRTVGVFDNGPDGVVHTDTSRLLRRDAAATVAPFVDIHTDRGYAAWADLLVALREGGSAFERQRGMPMFEWLSSHPDEGARFNDAMAAGSRQRREVLLARDWSGATSVVDVGGGTGTNLLAVLEAHPHLSGTVLDLPSVREQALALMATSPAGDRCRFVAGSFFDDVPVADTYVMAVVLHDWDDEQALRILRACRRAAPDGARLVVVETVLADGEGWDWAPWMDLHMLVMLGGRERTEAQWRQLLHDGGWDVEAAGPRLLECRAQRETP
ncbi:methyltransferase [Phycicoccus sp. M110.8]|uniref:methyltransferase n=1 Tax=Phycicoccus sp. M110.8 TaxID=3075433 RepID=UPI0028FD5006|nr:methyltransferase [Phycicoccus sp. M110.8]MDU0315014.1 methyltransferase [Phycicoccus sp. M110.8]